MPIDMEDVPFIRALEDLLASHAELSVFDVNIAELNTYAVLRRLVVSGTAPSLPRLRGCDATRGRIQCFGPDALLYPCIEAVGVPQLALGEYFPSARSYDDRATLWRSRETALIRRCTDCKWLMFCGGPCPLQWIVSERGMDDPPCSNADAIATAFIDTQKQKLLGG